MYRKDLKIQEFPREKENAKVWNSDNISWIVKATLQCSNSISGIKWIISKTIWTCLVGKIFWFCSGEFRVFTQCSEFSIDKRQFMELILWQNQIFIRINFILHSFYHFLWSGRFQHTSHFYLFRITSINYHKNQTKIHRKSNSKFWWQAFLKWKSSNENEYRCQNQNS
jgi:hypothetical protein